MLEATLAHIWKYILFETSGLKTTDNKTVRIVDVGTENTNAGPDFSNAKIEIDDTLWAGNIELHINSKEWKQHKHQENPAYNNIVLHVVYNYDKPAFDASGRELTTLELKNYVFPNILQKIEHLKNSSTEIPCAKLVGQVGEFEWLMWKESLLVERLMYKSGQVSELLKRFNNDWETVFFVFLAKAFGLKVNANAMERLAITCPFSVVKKLTNQPKVLEALLFGQAGFLSDSINDDEYYCSLQNEYKFLKHKHLLEPIELSLWKFLRLRPPSFPTIRIAQLASLLNKQSNLLGAIIEAENLKELQNLLECTASNYWDTHYKFGKESKKLQAKKLGKSTITTIIINAICPVLFMYGKAHLKDDLCSKAIDWLNDLKAEKNSIITKWNELKVNASNAAESQALIHLRAQYCNQKQCLNCRVGKLLIRA